MIKLFLVFKINFWKFLNILKNFKEILQNYHGSFLKYIEKILE